VAATVGDNASENRYEIHDAGQLAGFAAYELTGDTIAFTHTEADPAFGGRVRRPRSGGLNAGYSWREPIPTDRLGISNPRRRRPSQRT
jgi:hypothetical protein